jgi:hypothetical protein
LRLVDAAVEIRRRESVRDVLRRADDVDAAAE